MGGTHELIPLASALSRNGEPKDLYGSMKTAPRYVFPHRDRLSGVLKKSEDCVAYFRALLGDDVAFERDLVLLHNDVDSVIAANVKHKIFR